MRMCRCGFKGGERSKSAPLPRAPPKGTVSASVLAELAGTIFQRVVEAGGVLPTTRLAISARDFYDTPFSEKEDSIMHFLGPGVCWEGGFWLCGLVIVCVCVCVCTHVHAHVLTRVRARAGTPRRILHVSNVMLLGLSIYGR